MRLRLRVQPSYIAMFRHKYGRSTILHMFLNRALFMACDDIHFFNAVMFGFPDWTEEDEIQEVKTVHSFRLDDDLVSKFMRVMSKGVLNDFIRRCIMLSCSSRKFFCDVMFEENDLDTADFI